MPLKAVIFDGFGTLFDGSPTLGAAIERAIETAHAELARQGHDVAYGDFRAAYNRARDRQKEARRTSNREFPIEDRLRDALVELHVDAKDPEALARDLAEAHMRGFDRFVLVHPEAPEVLTALKREGYRLGIASNYYHSAHLHDILRGVGVHAFFDAIVASADVGYVKPEPHLFREVLARLGVRPEEALMVGDTPEHDVRAAQALGMKGCYVPNPREGKREECPEADLVVTRLGDLPGAIAERFG